jgi:outer membrane beta-barrel protein
MTLLLALLLAASDPPAKKEVKVAEVALPPVAGGSQYTAPSALPPVTAQLFHVGGLLEVQPVLAVSVGDPFWRSVNAGLRLEHHWSERWSISAHALGGPSFLAAPVEMCGETACAGPASDQLRTAPGKLSLLAGAELGWAPVYGKLSLIGERTLHFDAYVSAGPELVRELIAQDATSAVAGRWEPGGRVSVGERLFFTDRFMVRVAASQLVWGSRVRGRGEIERKLTIEGGLAWLFGGR